MSKKPIVIVTVIALAAGAILFGKRLRGDAVDLSDVPEFEAKRGNLVIDVLEGGNIHALESLEIKNEVRVNEGTKILEIIDEGYQVTPEDVEGKKVLVRLDASAIEETIVDHDVEFQQTESAYAEAKQGLEIQESESLSAVKLVKQGVRFALLDFQKFLGEKAAREVLQSLSLPYDTETIDTYETDATEQIVKSFDAGRLYTETDDPTADSPFTGDNQNSQASTVDFSVLLKSDRLGEGEAEQTIRRLQDEALVAKTELAVVEEAVEGAKRLRERNFITKQTLENEMVGLEKAKLAVQTKDTELSLFRDYEFPKEAEKMLSTYEEQLLDLIREKREAMASVAQSEARFRSAKRRYELQVKKRADLQAQVDSCVIYAQKPGLVAYGGGNDNYYSSRYYDAISQGASLKLGQPIITIPDMSRLGVDVDIHESHIKKIQLGQRAVIVADAVADKTLEGKVTKVAVLPDSNASRYNPSLKVYPSTIEIQGTHDFLKPGMTAKVKIIVNELADVLYIPVQAIFVEKDKHYVFVNDGAGFRRQAVKVGDHNDEFVEIVEGIDEGAKVALRLPDGYEPDRDDDLDEVKAADVADVDAEKEADKKDKEA
ncbi:MAG: HlyD family efflux transporter periplasmic adaptor subunit [Verrucomicrobiae bacterium]|nr:HlyD family efflux transporter periplasmic adaptor subunit [Verrucomicrobiae bacterium]